MAVTLPNGVRVDPRYILDVFAESDNEFGTQIKVMFRDGPIVADYIEAADATPKLIRWRIAAVKNLLNSGRNSVIDFERKEAAERRADARLLVQFGQGADERRAAEQYLARGLITAVSLEASEALSKGLRDDLAMTLDKGAS